MVVGESDIFPGGGEGEGSGSESGAGLGKRVDAVIWVYSSLTQTSGRVESRRINTARIM